MKKILAVLLLAIGFVAGHGQASVSALGGCSITGAHKATWGCGLVNGGGVYSASITIEDTKTDGSCVYIYARKASTGQWTYTYDRECNGVPTTYYVELGGAAMNGFRIYRFSNEGNNYLTL